MLTMKLQGVGGNSGCRNRGLVEGEPPTPLSSPRLHSTQIAARVDSLTSAGQLTSAASLFNQAPVQTPPSGNIWPRVVFADFPSAKAKMKFPLGQSDDDWQ